MPAERVLVIDAGTSCLRAISVNAEDGSVRAIANVAWPLFVPEDAAPFGREFRARETESLVRGLLDDAARSSDGYHAIAITGQREGVVFADEDGHAVLASPNIDARASMQGFQIDADHAGAVYHATGRLPSLLLAPAKWRWLSEERPEDAARVRRVLPLADWIASLLTGAARTSRTLGVEVGVLDVINGHPAAGLLAQLGFDPGLIPPVIAEGTALAPAAGGPLAGVPVIPGGGDTQCGLVGAGCSEPGYCGIVAGWSAPVQMVTDAPLIDDARRTWTGIHVIADRWLLESNALETGRAWQWICHLLAVDDDAGDALACTAPVGADDTIAVLGPRTMDASRMRAGIGGIVLPLPLVMTAPERAHLLRAVLEAIAFTIRANLEQLEAITGVRVDAPGLGGGMSRSASFRRILADVLDRPLRVANSPHVTALGAAALAASAVGLHPSLRHSLDGMTAATTCIAPRAADAATYDDVYARWCLLAERFDALGEES